MASTLPTAAWRYRGVVDAVQRGKNHTRSRVRAKVEHSIGVIKRVFGYTKGRYRGAGEEPGASVSTAH
jgi:IS5 family transposase